MGCYKAQIQLCCCVQGVSIPPDNEVPCMCSLYGCNCYPKCGCCSKMQDLAPEFKPPPPRYLTMMNPQMMQQQQMMMQQQQMMYQMQQQGMPMQGMPYQQQ